MMKSILSLLLLTGAIYSADLSRDSDGIVTDNLTKLEWQDNLSSVKGEWSGAINYCEHLSLGGHDDWRLPNRSELITILDYSKNNPSIKENVFHNVAFEYYWSSSSEMSDSSKAWYVTFSFGNVSQNSKTNHYNIRCVRGQP